MEWPEFKPGSQPLKVGDWVLAKTPKKPRLVQVIRVEFHYPNTQIKMPLSDEDILIEVEPYLSNKTHLRTRAELSNPLCEGVTQELQKQLWLTVIETNVARLQLHLWERAIAQLL